MVSGAECRACAWFVSKQHCCRGSPEPRSPSQTCDLLRLGPSRLLSACCRPSSSVGRSACQACRQPPACPLCTQAVPDMQHSLRRGCRARYLSQRVFPFASPDDLTAALCQVGDGNKTLVRALDDSNLGLSKPHEVLTTKSSSACN